MRGRPKIDFLHSSKRTKYRQALDVGTSDLKKLLLATSLAAKKNGDKDLEYIIQLLYKNGNEIALKMRQLLEAQTDSIKCQRVEPLQALTHLLDNQFSKAQYVNTRFFVKSAGADIFPSYKAIQKSKLECRPPGNSLKVNDISAWIPLQELLDHTSNRLLVLQKDVVTFVAANQIKSNEVTFKLQIKWGFDGSTGQSQYNQKFSDEIVEESHTNDESLLATTIVPLRMTLNNNDNCVIWNNTTPQSVRWCRPLHLQFVKETKEVTLNEKLAVEKEINLLKPFQTTIAGVNISINYVLYLTMIDGKVLATINETSSQRCYICDATPKDFNNLTNMSVRFQPKEGTLNFGVSVLHLWIRSFEWLLHVSYRLPVEKWQMRGQLKFVMKNRKVELQTRFWKVMNLRVDYPTQGGNGNTNNGPLARRAFSKPELLAQVLELDLNLIKKISTILIALSCQFPLNSDLFGSYCQETAKLYVSLYKWFPMPQSIHKMLIHSRDILLSSDLPVGVLAEDASESCNKLYRRNREFHARKCDRVSNLTDLFNRSLDYSDPLIASYNQHHRQYIYKRKCIPPEVLHLLQIPVHPDAANEADLEVAETGLEYDEFLCEITKNLDEITLPEDPHYKLF